MAKIEAIVLFVLVAGVVNGLQHGQSQIGRSAVRDGFYCDTVTFPSAFTGSDPINVFTSLSLGSNSSLVHDVGFTWTESITSSSFRVCVVESGAGFQGAVRVNWMAYQDTESGVAEGSTRFNDWTTGTQCNLVSLPQSFPSEPTVFITARHNVVDKRHDAAAVWVENIAQDEFTICSREARTFDGRHKDAEVVWMAFTEVPLSWGHNEIITLQFPNSVQPSEEDNDAFCQIVNFTEPYFSPPSIVLTPSHEYDSSNVNAVPPAHNSIAAWNEEITRTYFRACVKDLVGLNRKHHPITVDYLVLGDLDPCINKTCDYFGNCQAVAASVAQCVCISECPTYEDLVCATNGQTFDNICIMKREICRTSGNFTYYHPGGCQGFPLDEGRHLLHQQDYPWSDTQCEVVSLKPYTFYPDKPVHVQLTVNYVNALQTSEVHEATVTWTENVNTDNFTACISRTGRNDSPSYDMESVDWIAYQGAPNGGVAGKERFTTWWTGTTCRTISFPSGKFSSAPTVLATLQHQRRSLKHDAASVWVEDVGSSSFKVCLRELQNFDGVHEDINVDWMAFEILHRPLFSEHGSINFPNDYTPLQSDNYAFCKTVDMERNYTKQPLVMVTPTHRTGGGRTNPQCNGISAWIETITSRNFRVCMKELYVNQYDPVAMQYFVVSDACGEGWTYFNGFCYLTNSTCTTWQAAQSSCVSHNANLISITNHEENIYVQHRHGEDTGWIGLQDLQRDGSFTWIDGSEVTFTYWAQNRPNTRRSDQNCVHTLGPRQGYHWNDVNCSACHPYTCKRDVNECTVEVHNCHTDATCTNTAGSFTCQCNNGYQGNGQTCSDVNECTAGTHNCHADATCTNTVGSFTCQCQPGFQGDGQTCSDVNECTAGTHNCHNTLATCTNTVGSFTCQCNNGYQGNGQTCSDVNECNAGTHNCHYYATCTNTVGSFTCQCNNGYQGDGQTCSDVNECSAGTHNCHYLATCTNTVGSFTCQCNPGYQGNGQSCSDVNECTAGTHNCHYYATCTNTVGSFTCQCMSGFQGNGQTCSDVNECSAGTHNCHNTLATCTNTVGSFTCQCRSGFQGDGQTCSDPTVRLIGGYYYGRVEVYYNGQWGTVCDDGWDLNDAHVVCRQLGFSSASSAHQSAAYGQGSGPIWLDDVNCYGSEARLQNCGHNGWGSHNCGHGEDASVVCNY